MYKRAENNSSNSKKREKEAQTMSQKMLQQPHKAFNVLLCIKLLCSTCIIGINYFLIHNIQKNNKKVIIPNKAHGMNKKGYAKDMSKGK